MEPEAIKRVREQVEAIKRIVIEEGGEATPARIRHKAHILSELSDTDILEFVKLIPELEVEQRRLHPLDPATRCYIVRLKAECEAPSRS